MSVTPSRETDGVAERKCVHCAKPLPADASPHRRYCDPTCREAHKWQHLRPRVPCSVCGEPTGWTGGVRETATHVACRDVKHGTRTMYARGCRCSTCRAWKAADFRAYKRLRREQGRPLPKHKQVPHAVRLAVYERDGYCCQLCGEPTDPTADRNSDWYPSIDHIAPVSAGEPDHSMSNLRTTHRWCNCVRGAARHDDDEFRTAS